MLGMRDLKPQDLQGLPPEALAELASQMLQHIQQQAQDPEYEAQEIQRKDRDISWRDAKLQKVTFKLARLKAWKFGAKSEAMRPSSGGCSRRPSQRTRRVCLRSWRRSRARASRARPQTSNAGHQSAKHRPSTCGAWSIATNPWTPTAGSPAATGRWCALAKTSARSWTSCPPNSSCTAMCTARGPANAASAWCREAGRAADHRRRHPAVGGGGAHADLPLRGPPAVLPAGDHQRTFGRVYSRACNSSSLRVLASGQWPVDAGVARVHRDLADAGLAHAQCGSHLPHAQTGVGQQSKCLSDLAHEDPWCGHRLSRPKSRAAHASLGHSEHPLGVRDQDGTLSAFSLERCPPSRRNAVRHHSGTASGIARNTQLGALEPSRTTTSAMARPPSSRH